MTLHNAGSAIVENIRYEELRVEEAPESLFHFEMISVPQWGKCTGRVRNVFVKNVTLTGDRFAPSIIRGYRAGINVDGVTFENLTILGRKIASLAEGKFTTNQFARDIRVKP